MLFCGVMGLCVKLNAGDQWAIAGLVPVCLLPLMGLLWPQVEGWQRRLLGVVLAVVASAIVGVIALLILGSKSDLLFVGDEHGGLVLFVAAGIVAMIAGCLASAPGYWLSGACLAGSFWIVVVIGLVFLVVASGLDVSAPTLVAIFAFLGTVTGSLVGDLVR